MAGINIYFDKECEEIIKGMEEEHGKKSGELSKICRQAVKEWDAGCASLETLRKKVVLLESKKIRIDSELNIINSRISKLEKEEAEEKKAMEENMENRQIHESKIKEQEKDNFFELVQDVTSGLEIKPDIGSCFNYWKNMEPQIGMINYANLNWPISGVN